MSGVIGMPAPAGLVHGMGKELTLPDWSPLTSAEVHTLLARLAPEIDALATTSGVWTSPGGAWTPDVLPADSAVALDLLADVHLQQEVRLFAS